MRTLAISNFKGGVGKTTTALNLAYVYAAQGKRVLLIDLNPQAATTDFFQLYERAESEKRSTIEVLYQGMPIVDAAFETETSNLFVLPSILELCDQNELLLHERALKFALDDASDAFDLAIIDCSPVMKRLTVVAFVATSEDGMVIVPAEIDATVMRGIKVIYRTIQSISNAMRIPSPKWKILRTRVPGKVTRNEQTGVAVLDRFFLDKLFDTAIHTSVKVPEGSWEWKPVVQFNPQCRPARDYVALAKEIDDEFSC